MSKISSALAGLVIGFATYAGAAFPIIPAGSAQLLNGTTVDLSAELQGKTTVLVIGFSRGSRDQVAGWGKRLAPDLGHSKDVAYFQIAEFAAVPRMLRGLVIKQVKASVPEPAQAHFLVVTEHEQEWKSVAGFSAPDEAYVVVVDRAGAVRWTMHGVASNAAYEDLKRHLE